MQFPGFSGGCIFVYGNFLKFFSENMSQKRKKIVLVDEEKIYENYKEIYVDDYFCIYERNTNKR